MQFQPLSDIEEMNEETYTHQFPLYSRLLPGVGPSPLSSSAALTAPYVAPGSRMTLLRRSTSYASQSSDSLYQESPEDSTQTETLPHPETRPPDVPVQTLFQIETLLSLTPLSEPAAPTAEAITAPQEVEANTLSEAS